MKYVPATPAPERTRSPKNKAMFVLSPVFGASVVLLGVSGVVGCSGVGSSGVSGTSVIVTVLCRKYLVSTLIIVNRKILCI